MSTVRVTRRIRIDATTETVWTVLATPSLQSVVDARVRVSDERGVPGEVGSGYALSLKGRPTTHIEVTDAVLGERLVAAFGWNGRTRGLQEAHLRPVGSECALTYTFVVDVPILLHPVQHAFAGKQLQKWLKAVARASAAPQ